MLTPMDDTEIKRLRRTIRRSFSNSPHRKKYWLALVDMYAAKDKTERSQKGAVCVAKLAPAMAVRLESEPASTEHRRAADPKAGGVRNVR